SGPASHNAISPKSRPDPANPPAPPGSGPGPARTAAAASPCAGHDKHVQAGNNAIGSSWLDRMTQQPPIYQELPRTSRRHAGQPSHHKPTPPASRPSVTSKEPHRVSRTQKGACRVGKEVS